MRIEEPDAGRSFEQALAEEEGWSLARAEAVAAEYRRFLYLAATSDAELTPSRAIDKAWHLHLTYTRHYWEVLCGAIIGRPLHHRPSPGGAIETERFRRQYEDMLARYEAEFGAPPPPAVWPRRSPARRRARGWAPAEEDRRGLVWMGVALAFSAGVGLFAGFWAFVAAAMLCLALALVAGAAKRADRRGSAAAGTGGVGAGCGGAVSAAGWTGDCGDGGAGCGGGGCGGGD
jgi:hypothetical protein